MFQRPVPVTQRPAAMSRPIAGVIFDLDGVLIDSAEAHFQSWQKLAAAFGTTVTRDAFKQTFGRPNADILPRLFGNHLSPDEVREMGEQKERLYREIAGDHIKPIAGAVELVTACHDAGLICGVGSSGHPLNIELALKTLGIADRIQAVVSGHDVQKGKPDPEVFLKVADRIGLEPHQCVVIEDAPVGIDAALAAGMIAVAVATEHPPEQLSRAHHVAASPKELSPATLATLAATAT